MLQKELAKRLKARYDTKMDGNEWLEVSSDGIPLCRIKYNGQYLSNADQSLSDEYRSKISDIQEEISTVREYVGLYEHAPQMKADGVSDYRQLAAFGDTVLAATYNEKNGFPNNMLLGLGIMLAANEVPRIAQQFGLDSSVRVNMMSVVHATTTAVNLTRSVAKAAGK